MSGKIAVLLTCFNRIEFTTRCLNSLFKTTNNFDVYLVDDGSTDNTATIIHEKFPQVKIIAGTGNLFWNRGMILAWKEAIKNNYDYYLWLNNDIVLYENALEELFSCLKEHSDFAIISGVIENDENNEVAYGGYDENKKLIVPNGVSKPITFLNGNLVLVSKSVIQKIGILDSRFHHDLGDVDYGLRAIKASIPVKTTRIPVGSGSRNPINRVRIQNVSIVKRFENLYSPLGSNPFITFYFRRKHFNIVNALVYFMFIHFLNILPDYFVNQLFKNKY